MRIGRCCLADFERHLLNLLMEEVVAEATGPMVRCPWTNDVMFLFKETKTSACVVLCSNECRETKNIGATAIKVYNENDNYDSFA